MAATADFHPLPQGASQLRLPPIETDFNNINVGYWPNSVIIYNEEGPVHPEVPKAKPIVFGRLAVAVFGRLALAVSTGLLWLFLALAVRGRPALAVSGRLALQAGLRMILIPFRAFEFGRICISVFLGIICHLFSFDDNEYVTD